MGKGPKLIAIRKVVSWQTYAEIGVPKYHVVSERGEDDVSTICGLHVNADQVKWFLYSEKNIYDKDVCISCEKAGAMSQNGKVKPTTLVYNPAHYLTGEIEPIDFIHDQKLGFNLGNALKCIVRAKHKGKLKEDLQKAVWYLNDEIKRLG